MTKKKIIYMYILAIAISAIIFILSIGKSFGNEKVTERTETPQTVYESGYVLGEYNGKIALFRSGSEEPYKKIDFNVDMLTEYDKQMVRNGIYTDTEQELNRLIEDLTS